jgi:signal peptidase II
MLIKIVQPRHHKDFILPNLENSNQTTNEQNHKSDAAPKKSLRDLTGLIPLFFGAGVIIFLDQLTKSLVVKNIPFLGTWLPENLIQFHQHFRIVHWRNSGAAFGIFSDGNTFFLILAVLASVFIISFYPMIAKEEWSLRLAMIFQLGGALGNMIDRIRYGYVIDFISVKNFPVFNIADSSISIGVAILLLGILIQEIKLRKNKQDTPEMTITTPTRKEEAE